MTDAVLSQPGPVARAGTLFPAVDARSVHSSYGNVHTVNGI
jgi:hypothetical protein